MAKIKKTDITKLSKLEQQIEELKQQKKQQEEQVAKNIGSYILNKIGIDELESTEELYQLIDETIEKYNSEKTNNLTDQTQNEVQEDNELQENI